MFQQNTVEPRGHLVRFCSDGISVEKEIWFPTAQ